MNIIKPLIFPIMKDDETPIGFLIRVAELNSYDSYRWLVNKNDAQEVISKSHKRISKLLLNTPWTKCSLESPTQQHIHNIDPVYFVTDKLKFCPLCLKEGGYYKFNWQYKTSVACTRHKIWLQDRCPKCGSLVAINNSKIAECDCGFDLSLSKAENAPDEVISMQRFLEHGETCDLSLINSDHNFDICERMDLLTFFSKWLADRTKISRNLSTMSTAKPYMADVSEALFAGEVGFYNFLGRLHKRAIDRQDHKNDLFTNFHRSFYKNYRKDCFKKIKHEIEHYLHNHWEKPLTRRNKNFQAETIDQHPWIALQKACRDFGLHKSEINRAISQHLVRSKKEEKEYRIFTLVYRPDLEARLDRIKDTVTSIEAASILGLTKRQFSQIRESGLFRYRKPIQNVESHWQFSKTELYDYRKEFFNGVSDHDGKEALTLSQLLKYFGGGISNGLSTLIDAIQNSNLKIVGRKRGTYSITGALIDTEEFLNWYKSHKDEKGFISVPTLAKLLGLQQEFTYQLVSNGLIKHIKCGGNHNRYINIVDMDDFNNKYCILSKLSKKMKLNSKDLIYYLKTKNIFPVDHDWNITLRQKVYEKSLLKSTPLLYGCL